MIRKKISGLVKRGYKEAAFRRKAHAEMFAREWREKGYKVSHIRSSGPTVEGGYKRHAYYMIARKRKGKMPLRKIVKKRKPRRKAGIGWGI